MNNDVKMVAIPKKKVEIGDRYGRWLVIGDGPKKNKNQYHLCQCDCGTIKQVLDRSLKYGKSSSCGCYRKECAKEQITKYNKSLALDLTGQRFGLLVALEPDYEKSKSDTSITWKCQCDCGNITYVTTNNLKGTRPTRSCGCLSMKRKSVGELNIANILKENNIEYIHEYKNLNLQKESYLRFDFYLPTYNRLIEFDGIQHYEENDFFNDSLENIQTRDKMKNQWAKENNIPLVRIPYWERDNITLEMLLGDQYLVKEDK